MILKYVYSDGLESKNLRTRFLTTDDIAPWIKFFEDTEGTKYLHVGAGLPPAERAAEWINFSMKRYAEKSFGVQALIEKETGAFVGLCGLITQDLNGVQEVEIGYHLLKEHRGKGYATEAAQMFRDYAFENNITDSVISIINPENEASKSVARRNGMQLSASNVPFRNHTYNVFRITRNEWEIQRGPAIL
ncbi:MAG: N-acetyltransferase [Sphingobacteriales bacterium]|nr:MAG: N-acetyltransferase [Sphingobacteriales bacterium]